MVLIVHVAEVGTFCEGYRIQPQSELQDSFIFSSAISQRGALERFHFASRKKRLGNFLALIFSSVYTLRDKLCIYMVFFEFWSLAPRVVI